MIKLHKRTKIKHDGIFLNKGDGTIEVLYSKYNFLKKGELIDFETFSDKIGYYKKILVTDEYLTEDL